MFEIFVNLAGSHHSQCGGDVGKRKRVFGMVFEQEHIGGDIHQCGTYIREEVMEEKKDCLRVNGLRKAVLA